ANYYATGNILRPVETAGWSYREGHVVGAMIADDLEGKLSDIKDASVLCRCEDPVKLVVPQRIIPGRTGGFKHLQLRVSRAVKGELIIADNLGREWKKKMSVLPERRILVALSELGILENTGTLRVYFKE
ncbi:MAG: pyridine nucleotide-disulfide oxidoreductase, partial [Kordiimonadaceae bacterium]|nr:pyridine nucleotide-disulfide oxidoreductase [Kordiimonadaceae bacterium]